MTNDADSGADRPDEPIEPDSHTVPATVVEPPPAVTPIPAPEEERTRTEASASEKPDDTADVSPVALEAIVDEGPAEPEPPALSWRTLLLPANLARLAIFAIGAGFFVLYLRTLTAQHTFDSVSYALDIRRFDQGYPINRLFHPHHLLFSSFGYLVYQALSAFRPQTTTLEAIQVFASLMGAIGLAAFAAWVYEETRSIWAATTGAIALGSTFGWWFGSTDGRANLVATAILLCGVYALDRAARLHSARRWWVNAGILLGAACLLHQNHGMFLPVALLTALLTPGSSWAQRRSWALWLLAAFTVTVVIPYSVVVFGILRMETPQDAAAWMTTYAREGTWWNLNFVRNLAADGRALVKFLTGFELMQPVREEAMTAYRYVTSIWMLLAAAALVGALRGGWWRRRAFLTPPLLGLLCYGAFFTIWDPGYFVHWFAFSAFLIAFAALGWLEAGTDRLYRALLTLCVLILLGVTGTGIIRDRMNADKNPFRILAERVDRVSGSQDLVIAAGMGYGAEAQIYVPYFARVNTIALHDKWKDAGGDTEKAILDLRIDIERVLDKGHRVFLLSDVILERSALQAMEKRFGVSEKEILEAFAPYDRQKVEWQGYIVIFELKRKPAPAALPATAAPTAPTPPATPAAPKPTPAPRRSAPTVAPRPKPVRDTRPEPRTRRERPAHEPVAAPAERPATAPAERPSTPPVAAPPPAPVPAGPRTTPPTAHPAPPAPSSHPPRETPAPSAPEPAPGV